MRQTVKLLLLITAAMLATIAAAQNGLDPGPIVIGGMAGAPPLPPPGGMVSMKMDVMDAEPIKGAPFCATITTEHTQLFADGNRIHTSDSSNMCRDNEGRIRRDSDLNLMGAAPQKAAAKLVTIIDPVAGYRYLLNSDTKIAHKMPLPKPSARAGMPGTGKTVKEERVMVFRSNGDAGPGMNVFYKQTGPAPNQPASSENLGDQTIEGIRATGTRMTTTIPAGQMGNDQPIMVTSERWYSPELKATIMTKHNDPWAGELKTQFTGVNTSEPAASLFTVPSDYRIIEDKDGPMVMHLPAPPPPGAPAQ